MLDSTKSDTPPRPEGFWNCLPQKTVVRYRKREIIYSECCPVTHLCLILEGAVESILFQDDRPETLLDVYVAGDFFGENCLLDFGRMGERVVALDRVSLISWSGLEITRAAESHPGFGLALLRILALRNLEHAERLRSLATEKTEERVARALLRFAARLGTREPDGTVRIRPLTHQSLSDYVGTSREVVTLCMNSLRQQGRLNYSREGIAVNPAALRECLRTQPLPAWWSGAA